MSAKEGRITFNVGGMRYETALSTVARDENTPRLLDMLVRRRRDGEQEIFIDRDGGMFRWILHWYRTGVIVDYGSVGVSKPVWDEELLYYGIATPGPKCVCCGKAPRFVCQRCYKAAYCGDLCQELDEPAHRDECERAVQKHKVRWL